VSEASTATRFLLAGIALGVASLPAPVAADQPSTPRIGVFVPLSKNSPTEEGLRSGLRELGYVEGKNILIEWRRSAGGDDRSIAAELARAKLDVIVVASTAAARSALEVTKSTPVVFLSGDPVGSGLVASLAKPGGNATGVSGVLTELTAKQLELLRAITPRVRRIACLMSSTNPSAVQQLEAARKAAHALGAQIIPLDARNDSELDAALHALAHSGVDSVLVTGDILFRANKSRIAQAVRKAKLPGAFPYREYHDYGVLIMEWTLPTRYGIGCAKVEARFYHLRERERQDEGYSSWHRFGKDGVPSARDRREGQDGAAQTAEASSRAGVLRQPGALRDRHGSLRGRTLLGA